MVTLTEKHDEQGDIPDDVPIDVILWATALQKPIIASAILGLPLGLIFYFVGPYFFEPKMPLVAAVSGWLSGTITVYLLLRRPY